MYTFSVRVIFLLLSLTSIIEADGTVKDKGVRYTHTIVSSSASLENGRNKLEELKVRMKLPQYGDCWSSAISDLEVACKIMDANIQTRLALEFTSCFVEMLGFPPYLCDKNGNIQDCVKNLDQRGYHTFLEYFLHTQDMCFFLTSQMWQEETDKTVTRLAFAAAGVSDTLEDTKKTQDEILKSQQEALKVQSNIMKDNNALYNAMITFKSIFDDLTVRADEHTKIFREIFDQLTVVQQVVSWIQSEMSLLDTITFYFITFILAFVFTSPERTRGARPTLVMLYSVVFALERTLSNHWTAPEQLLTPEVIELRIRVYRYFACTVGLLVIMHSAYTFRDFNSINNKLITDMHHTLDSLMGKFQRAELVPALHNAVMAKELKSSECIDDENNDEETDSNDSDSSDYSNDSDTLSDSSVSTNIVEIDLTEQSSLLEEGRLMFPELDKENKPANSKILNIVDEDVGPPMLSSTPIGRSLNSTPHRYNLRERRTSSSNPLLKTETPMDFVRKMKSVQRKSQSNSVFSSDEDL